MTEPGRRPQPGSPVAARVVVVRSAAADATGRTTSAAVVTVDADEPVLPGHYPHFPIYPGVCVIECVHLSGLHTAPAAAGPLRLAGVESARFLGPVFPGDRLDVDLEWTGGPPGVWRCTGKVTTERSTVARVRLRFADTPGEGAAA
ncbi:3-hydroxyacyl-ACP dehydratase FabZ family protein [Streptomyces fildesensis]|uniref:3-hydroxyacyl-ACP dehydratase FabZ family protein n=1 Tax=Streptomyces fildesensis TaxID=375757 RepID=A0ABW8C393_9ACTN